MRRKYYEEEKRRIEEDYQRELVKIDEEFQRAAQKMKSDFNAERKAVLRQHSGCKVSEEAVVEPAPVNDKTQPKNDCTRASNPNEADSPEQPSQTKPLPKKSTVPRSVINGESESASYQRRGKLTKTTSADAPTADLFVSSLSLTSSIHSSNQMSAKECETNSVKTMAFVKCDAYETCAEQIGSGKVACRVLYHPTIKQYFQHSHRRRRHRRRRRRRKQENCRHLKKLLFDPGGHCVVAVERGSLVCMYLSIRIDCSTVLPSRYYLLCSETLREFDGTSNENCAAVKRWMFTLLPVSRGGNVAYRCSTYGA